MLRLESLIFLLLLVICFPAFSQTPNKSTKTDSIENRAAIRSFNQDSIANSGKKKPNKKVAEKKNSSVPKDSTRLALERLPKESAMRSLIVPGLGQIHNHRIWKVPLVYGGYVTLALVYNFEQHNYRETLHEVQYRLLNNRQTRDEKLAPYSFEALVQAKDYYRRNRDLCILGFALWHTFQVVDAYVDAKLKRFDVSPDLVMDAQPKVPGGAFAYSLVPQVKVRLRF